MKNLKRLGYIVISLILFQSFSAVANSLDFYAIDTQHLQHEHKHSEHKQEQSELSANETSDKVSTEHHNPAPLRPLPWHTCTMGQSESYQQSENSGFSPQFQLFRCGN